MRKDFNIDGKYVVLSVSTNIQSPAVIVTVKLSDRMPDIDSISVAFPVKSMRGAEHFVMNATEEEARRGFAKVMSEFGEFLGHVDKALSISSARSKALTASMMNKKAWQGARLHKRAGLYSASNQSRRSIAHRY